MRGPSCRPSIPGIGQTRVEQAPHQPDVGAQGVVLPRIRKRHAERIDALLDLVQALAVMRKVAGFAPQRELQELELTVPAIDPPPRAPLVERRDVAHERNTDGDHRNGEEYETLYPDGEPEWHVLAQEGIVPVVDPFGVGRG